MSQHTTLVPASWGIRVASRSGSASTASKPASAIAWHPAAPRLVPRTTCPSSASACPQLAAATAAAHDQDARHERYSTI